MFLSSNLTWSNMPAATATAQHLMRVDFFTQLDWSRSMASSKEELLQLRQRDRGTRQDPCGVDHSQFESLSSQDFKGRDRAIKPRPKAVRI